MGIAEAMNTLRFGMLGRMYLPEGTYIVGTRGYNGHFGTFSVDANLDVTANAGLAADTDGRLLIDRSAQGEFRLRGFSTPDGWLSTHIAELSTGYAVEQVFYLPPATYRIAYSNYFKVADWGTVTVASDRSIMAGAGLLLDDPSDGTLVPDACAHHVLSFTPASGVSYRVFLATGIADAPRQGVFPEVTSNLMDVSGQPSTYFDITADGPSQTQLGADPL